MSNSKYHVFNKKWFGTATPVNAVASSQTIGSGIDGTVTITADSVGDDANSLTIEVVEGSGLNVAMSATLTDSAIMVTLGTDGAGALDATKNFAVLVAVEIDALDGVNSVASGADPLTAAEAEQSFTGGQYATKVATPAIWKDGLSIYVAEKGVSKTSTDGWLSATLA
jgi:hypothetical protein